MIYSNIEFSSDIDIFCKESLLIANNYTDSDKLSEEDYFEIIKKIKTILEKIVTSFSTYLVEGTYVINDDFQSKLILLDQGIEKSVSKVYNEFALSLVLDPIMIVEQIKKIHVLSSTFLRFIENVKLKFKFHEKRFYINESLHYTFSRLEFKDEDAFVNLFYANLFVAQCDHFVSNSDKESLRKLEEIIEFLGTEDLTDSITERVFKKAYFLRHKINLRFVEELKSNDSTAEIYVSKSGKNELFKASEVITENYLDLFQNWNEYLLTHYQIFDDWKSRLQSKCSPSTNLSNLKVLELHRLIKYSKDSVKNEKLLKLISAELKIRINNGHSEADNYAEKICLSYCFNNEFSLAINDSTKQKSEITELYKEIMLCPELAQIKNYFVPALMLSYHVKTLTHYFDNKIVIQNIEECKTLIDSCELLETIYRERIDWVKKNYNYIFQLPMDECVLDIRPNEKLFVFSSVFLPISRNSLEKRFKTDIDSLRIYRASIENLLITKTGLDEIENLTEEFKKTKEEFAKKESKTLEMVVLVSAIMTFVAGSIPGFKFINSGTEAFLFTIALGSSLTWFALLFYVINRGMDFYRKLKGPLIIGVFLLIFSWLLVYWFSNQNTIDVTKIHKTTLEKSCYNHTSVGLKKGNLKF